MYKVHDKGVFRYCSPPALRGRATTTDPFICCLLLLFRECLLYSLQVFSIHGPGGLCVGGVTGLVREGSIKSLEEGSLEGGWRGN